MKTHHMPSRFHSSSLLSSSLPILSESFIRRLKWEARIDTRVVTLCLTSHLSYSSRRVTTSLLVVILRKTDCSVRLSPPSSLCANRCGNRIFRRRKSQTSASLSLLSSLSLHLSVAAASSLTICLALIIRARHTPFSHLV
jgi:hypothetical protein